MTKGRQFQIGEVGLQRADDGSASVPVRPEPRWSPTLDDAAAQGTADLTNVVPFRRVRDAQRGAAPEVSMPAGSVAPVSGRARDNLRLAAFAALSLVVHGGLLAACWRDPAPLASIGVPVMSVEIVVGATAPAGVAPEPGKIETQAAAAATDPQQVEPAREAEQKATEQPQAVPVAARDAAPDQVSPLEPQTEEPKPPLPEQQTAEPMEAKPVPPTPLQRKPEPKHETKPRVAAKPVETKAAEPKRIAAPTRSHPSERARAAPASNPANNIGVGQSDYDTNYRGLVAAHLARYKQYPADARSSGKTGVASVTFSIGGGGGVTSVSLARSSGVPSIDHEVVAMVRRASPFPAPPGGQPQSFTVPVSFRLN